MMLIHVPYGPVPVLTPGNLALGPPHREPVRHQTLMQLAQALGLYAGVGVCCWYYHDVAFLFRFLIHSPNGMPLSADRKSL